jgi:ribosomal protein S18 acetylase RimI-like enzyme
MPVTFSRLSINDRETIVHFRKDAHVISFGNDHDFDEDKYLQFIQKGSHSHPDGFIFVLHDGKPIGQMEMHFKEKDRQRYGFVNLFYLIPEYRGKGFSHHLDDYATRYFKENGCTHCLLRVEKNNQRAIRFYEKNGFYPVAYVEDFITYKKDL